MILLTLDGSPVLCALCAATGRVTVMSDVYSFGVILMELITGRRALDESQPENRVQLVAWLTPHIGDPEKLFRVQGSYSLSLSELPLSRSTGLLLCVSTGPVLSLQGSCSLSSALLLYPFRTRSLSLQDLYYLSTGLLLSFSLILGATLALILKRTFTHLPRSYRPCCPQKESAILVTCTTRSAVCILQLVQDGTVLFTLL